MRGSATNNRSGKVAATRYGNQYFLVLDRLIPTACAIHND